jgi:hypothetical protein
MEWYKILLSNDAILGGHLQKVNTEFARLVSDAGAPREAALFAGDKIFSGQKGDLGVLPLYFSLGSVDICASLIASYSGAPCEKPSRAGLKLVSGRGTAWQLVE